MSDEAEPTGEDPAAQAFESLRQEVASLCHAVAELTAERPTLEFPDYTVTLGKILQTTQSNSGHLKALAEMPALRLSASGWSREIATAGEEARRSDHAMLERARDSFQQAANSFSSSLRSAQTAHQQRQWLLWTNLASLFAGMCLWAILMGPLLRTVPGSWHWPEQMAARLMGMHQEEAGAHLIATAAPDHWQDIVLGYGIITKNRNAIEQCERQLEATRKPVPCIVLVQNTASK